MIAQALTQRREPGQLAAPGSAPLFRLLRLARPQRGRLLIAAAAGALGTGCGVALLAVSGYLLARASQHPNVGALAVAVVAVRALSLGRGVFRYGERLASHDVAIRVLARMRVTIWRRLESLAPSGLAAFRSGDLLARLVGDVDATQELFVRGVILPLAAAAVGTAAVLACLILLAPAGLVLALGLLMGAIVVPASGLAAARSAARQTAPARGTLGSAVTDLLAGAPDLQAFGATGVALDRTTAAGRELTALARRNSAASALGAGLAALAAGLTLCAVAAAGAAAAASGTLGRVPLAVLVLTALAAFEAVHGLPAAVLELAGARASARRIAEVMDAPDPVVDPPTPRELRAGGRAVTVALRDARVRYRPDGPLALDGVSLDVPPGRRIALVGPTGAGKSTVAAVLLRFVSLASGCVTLDGHDLASYRADDVRTAIGGCPQDPHLFDASIRDNLRLAQPDADDEQLAAVAARAGLLDWIDALPDGMDTQVGQGGTAISGGQRQRIAVARALLADPAVLILDEPTAHVDADSRDSLVTDLLAAAGGRSVLLITHDLAGLDQVDEVIVLEAGRVVQRGTHVRLVDAGGLYERLWQARLIQRG
jgi:thiol reductant ABC exporter CydC subunit